ncbi:hypothetical protein CNMCM8812_004082 [Aspergillus fumigatus]|nr:hypothetical protein CNMCM8812_004082 [Aspergillus fumigatus]KAH1744327.1 hypothetical protein KXX41_002102 [Aspergillus fumigatus]KAH1874651.1 hypothetical protein KXX01_006777 [Aspergillus fumigatus]KAH2749726.1 hypothetical protein KXV66_005237 [Aspergillus fumigatus]KAH3399490.1 hypothetical protein KXV40_005193 [Aspergillus fumigatus]
MSCPSCWNCWIVSTFIFAYLKAKLRVVHHPSQTPKLPDRISNDINNVLNTDVEVNVAVCPLGLNPKGTRAKLHRLVLTADRLLNLPFAISIRIFFTTCMQSDTLEDASLVWSTTSQVSAAVGRLVRDAWGSSNVLLLLGLAAVPPFWLPFYWYMQTDLTVKIIHGDTSKVLCIQGVDDRRRKELVIRAPSLGAGRCIIHQASKLITHRVNGAAVIARVNDEHNAPTSGWTTTCACTFRAPRRPPPPQPTSSGLEPQMPGIVSNYAKFYQVKSGDSCWSIENAAGITLAQFRSWNTQIDESCTNLWVDYYVCIGV